MLFINQKQKCGINFPYVATCATKTGGVVAWSITTDYVFEQQLLDFPIIKGLFSFIYGQAFLQIDYAAYGSGILVGDLQYLLASQNFNTPKKIVDFNSDDDRMYIFTVTDTGDVTGYHFTPQPAIIVQWQQPNQSQLIGKIIIFQEAYKYIILSQAITVFDYLNQEIYKVKQLHNQIVKGAVIDKSRYTVISYNQDTSKNLFYWNYETDVSAELVGHTAGINGAYLIDLIGTLITYSQDGYIIVWNYLQAQKISTKLNLHNQKPVLDLFIRPYDNQSPNSRTLFISKGENNQISIYDYTKGESISSILLSVSYAKLVIDDLYKRIFILYTNSIHVYSYITGLKVTELLGFDGDIGSNFIIEDNYIIAAAQLVIQSFNRQTLDLLNSDKSTYKIFQISLLGDLIGIISDSLNDIVKVWNYKTGTMLQDMTNQYYPIPVNGIISDKEAKIFLVRNIYNHIFTFNPFSQSFSKVEDFMILPIFSSDTIQEILIDKQSNIMIAYNSNQIMQWKLYCYLGRKGQEISLPTNSKINLAYHPTKGNQNYFNSLIKINIFINKDQIFYADFEKNLWLIQQNQQYYVLQLQTEPLQAIIVGNVLIIREQSTIKSFNTSFTQITTLSLQSYLLISDPQEKDFFFIVNMTQDIIKVLVDQSTFILTQKAIYQQKDGVIGSSISRIVFKIINTQYKHLILGAQDGCILVVNYSTDKKLATLTSHTKRVTKILYDQSNNLMVSSSIDGSVGLYQYSQNAVQLIANAPIGGQIDQILLDLQYGRLIVWINLQTKIFIFNPLTMKITGQLLAPGDVNIQLKISSDFNKYAIFNYYQINIYERDTMQFISNIRFPSELQDIIEVDFLSSYYILVRSQTSVRIYKISAGQTSTLINQYNMAGSQIVAQSFDPNSNIVNLKGANYQTAFNYTFIIYSQDSTSDSNSDKSYCYTNIYNSKNVFTLRRNIELQEASFTQFGLDSVIKSVKYNIIYQTDQMITDPIQVFYPTVSNGVSKYQNLIVYDIMKNSNGQQPRVYIGLQNAYSEYPLESLKLSKFVFYITEKSLNANPQPITFHQNTKTFVFNDGLLQSQITKPIVTHGFLFQNVTTVIMEKFVMNNVYFDGTYTTSNRILESDNDSSSLFTVNTAQYVYIKQIIVSDCILKDQNIFKLQNVDTIIIDEIQIKNISFESSFDQMLSIFQIINCKNITISNINITNIHNSNLFNVFQMFGNVNTNISQVELSSVTNLRMLFYTQTYSENEFEYKVNKDNLSISTVTINTVNVDSLSQIDITTNNAILSNINANKVICKNCVGSVIQAEANQFTLTGSHFSNSEAFKGGAISLKNCSVKCQFLKAIIENNKAINGGGIFLQNSELKLFESQIINNQALIGGGVRYNGIIPYSFQNKNWLNDNNIITSNSATIFGKNLASYPRSIFVEFQNTDSTVNLVKNITSDAFSLTYKIQNIMSGDNFLLKVKLIDEEGESVKINLNTFSQYPKTIQEELQSYQIQCFTDNDLIQLNSETLVSLNKYQEQTSSFVFDKLVINSKPSSANHLYIKTNAIQLPSTTNSSLFYSPQFSAFNQIEFRQCKIGEIFIQKQAGQLEYCKKCPEGMYSLQDPKDGQDSSISCQICPNSAIMCKENVIQLKNGYWRDSNSTDLIIDCSNAPDNCEGQSSNSRFYCKEGYIGPLCESCDIEGKVWDSAYSKVGAYQCLKCSSMKSEYLIQALAFIMIIGYVCIGVRQSNLVSTKKILGYYLRMVGFASVGTSDCEDYTSIFLKFLMHYLYIRRIIKIYSFQLPFAFDFIQIQISSPIDSMRFVPDCYRSIFNQSLKPVYSRQVISQILPLIYLTSVSLIYFILVGLKKIKHSINQVYNGLVFLFIFIQPDLISGIISASSCRSIGNNQYITDDITEKCLTKEHVTFLVSFCLTFFVLWGLVLPLILFLSIYKVRNNLSYISARIRYGFLYQEYQFKAFYWEFLKIALKLLITIVDNFMREEEILKSSLSSLFILIYVLLSIRLKPYISHLFNKCDQYSHIILILILQFNVIITISGYQWLNSIAIILFHLFDYSLLAFLIVQIFKSKFKMVIILLLKKFPSLKSYFPTFFDLLNIKLTNKMTVYKNWKKVWQFIYMKHFTKRRDENASQIQLARTRDQSRIKMENNNSPGFSENYPPKSIFHQINSPTDKQMRRISREEGDESQNDTVSIDIQLQKVKEPFPQIHSIKSIAQHDTKKGTIIDEELMSNIDFLVQGNQEYNEQQSAASPFASYNFQDSIVKKTNFDKMASNQRNFFKNDKR